MEERLQKIIARAGITSRRNAEKLVTSGLVTVNGKMVTELGSKADPERDHIKVNGKLLRIVEEGLYLMLNKPTGVVCSLEDPQGRASLRGLLHGLTGRAYPVGVLEYHAQGLVVLTNDGELTHALMRGRVAQTFWYKVKGRLDTAALEEVQKRARITLRLVKEGNNAWYEAHFVAGTTRQDMERLVAALIHGKHPVEKVRRVGYANLTLGKLAAGKARQLDPREARELRRAAGLTPEAVREAGAAESRRARVKTA